MNTIYLAGGCFWGMQKFLDQFDGVLETEVGYANGPDRHPLHRRKPAAGHPDCLRTRRSAAGEKAGSIGGADE